MNKEQKSDMGSIDKHPNKEGEIPKKKTLMEKIESAFLQTVAIVVVAVPVSLYFASQDDRVITAKEIIGGQCSDLYYMVDNDFSDIKPDIDRYIRNPDPNILGKVFNHKFKPVAFIPYFYEREALIACREKIANDFEGLYSKPYEKLLSDTEMSDQEKTLELARTVSGYAETQLLNIKASIEKIQKDF